MRKDVYIVMNRLDLQAELTAIIDAALAKHKLIQPPEQPPDEWLTISQAAAIVRRDKSRLYSYVRTGLINAYKMKGCRGLRFKRSELECVIKKLDFGRNIQINNFKIN